MRLSLSGMPAVSRAPGVIAAALSLVALCFGGAAALAAGSGPIVHVEGGRISGTSAQGVMAFRGIPYAAPPVGDLRWRPPQPAPAWQGVRPANKLSPLCTQQINTSDNGTGP